MDAGRKLKCGQTVEEIPPEEKEKILAIFPMFDDVVRLQPASYFSSVYLPDVLDALYDFQFRPDDVIVCTYPKSGTTWTQEIVWTLLLNPDLDNPEANTVLDIRSPHIDADFILAPKKIPKMSEDSVIIQFLKKHAPEKVNSKFKMMAVTEALKSPRVIKIHLSIEMFPPSALNTAKIIYVARDARDIIVSKYYMFKKWILFNFQGTLDEFIDTFIEEKHFHHPYWRHIKVAYELRDHSNMHFLYFEDLKANPTEEITKIAHFLGLNRTPQQIQNVVNYTNFKNMKSRADQAVNHPMTDGGRLLIKNSEEVVSFFRKGTAGDWKNSFTDEQVEKITKWMKINMKMFPPDFKYKA